MKIRHLLLFFSLAFTLLSCKKEKLDGELDALKGQYRWIGYLYSECALCSIKFADATNADYKANIKFDNSGKVDFIIDDKSYLRKRFRITSKDITDTYRFSIDIKVDVSKSQLDINDMLTIIMLSKDTIIVNKYPNPGYKSERESRGNYFVRQ